MTFRPLPPASPTGSLKRAVFTGMGSYLPKKRITNRDLEKTVDTTDQWIVQRTGIRERRCAGTGETTSDLAVEAAREALASARLPPGAIDTIIVSTMSPDTITPSTASRVQAAIGATGAAAFDLNAACTGFIYGTTVGAAFIKSGFSQHLLIVGSECNSRFVDWKDRSSCVLFGDGAGAAVLSVCNGKGESDIIDYELGCDGNRSSFIRIPAGGAEIPATRETVAAGLHFLKLDGRGVYRFVVDTMVAMFKRMIQRNRLKAGDISLIVPHQVNYRIIDTCCARLGLPMDTFFLNMDRYGNTSSASVPIAMDEAIKADRLRRGDLICTMGFGAGMTWGYNLFRW